MSMSAEQLAELAVVTVLASKHQTVPHVAKQMIAQNIRDAMAEQKRRLADVARAAAIEGDGDPDTIRARVLAG